MKATIVGSDLLQKDDSVKIIEINTNTCISNDGADLLDYTALFNVLISNNITEFHYIWTDAAAYLPLNQPHKFRNILETKCLENKSCGFCTNSSGQGKCISGNPSGPNDLEKYFYCNPFNGSTNNVYEYGNRASYILTK